MQSTNHSRFNLMTRRVKLTQGKFALVSAKDFSRVNSFVWHLKRSRTSLYAARTVMIKGKRTTLFLHQFITGRKGTDHQDGNGLNNRRSNLRPATHVQNCRNRRKRCDGLSKFVGVARRSGTSWRSTINVFGKRFELGHFKTEIEAALAYNEAAEKHFGQFARLNKVCKN